MGTPFRVQQIDHVELFVPDQDAAAHWYHDVLGLERVAVYQAWEAAGGPLMLSSDGGGTMLAVFNGEARGQRLTAGHHRVAFRVDGAAFLTFVQRVATVAVYRDDGQQAHDLPVIDHDLAWSVYFCDPYGNRYEVTTYDYQFVADARAKGEQP